LNILAIDSSGLVAAAAIVSENQTVAECSINFKKTHSETLMPLVANLYEMTGLSPSDMDFIACSSGPGSFTGLRIGAGCAKGLAYGLGKKIIPVPTLDALAFNIACKSSLIMPLMDARRSQVYTCCYVYEGQGLRKLYDYMAVRVGMLPDIVADIGFSGGVIFVGDGADAYRQELAALPIKLAFAPPHHNAQRAAAVGALAVRNVDSAIDSADFAPFYLRMSQAERTRAQKP